MKVRSNEFLISFSILIKEKLNFNSRGKVRKFHRVLYSISLVSPVEFQDKSGSLKPRDK